ncbi:YHS domain-containing protein [Mycolicibacterium mucogenicum]|uniref:Guanylate cyclase domain-containing protein n=1 Tax=Mycolicibacterium aubagnense TaxID=319707 RepID=A0ABN5Z1Q3_9MYCO|nr:MULTISPECIES: YHS domain-containing protein [Mycobacteriaceae]MCX8564717.1 YHS domain-containing protein [Mycolicibacterium mucogenicum]TLH62731.1 YHS domain-containing protein [Mycolicibacterium aubagnense]BBX88112.1 hypothetical protein MAUB_63130 [Mycolicibacterium aubagnense]
MTVGAWTFTMIDLAGFTALTEAHGDEYAADLAVDFADLARTALAPGDRFIKSIGDAVLLASPDPTAGIYLTQRVLERCATKDHYLLTRTALHHGPAAGRGNDFFGAAINLTARLAAHAGAGQTLATDTVAGAARALGVPVEDLGETTFKNLSEPIGVHALHLGAPSPVSTVDPICRMRIEHQQAAGYLRHHGHEYWFCSLKCAAQFAREAADQP